MTTATDLLRSPRVLEHWRRRRAATVSEFADAARVLDPKFSAEGGQWRTARVPYAREWMDSMTNPWVRQVTVRASTQVGKSESANNIIAYFLAEDPSVVMLVMPRRPDARFVTARRILPMFELSPVLRQELTAAANDKTRRELILRRGSLYVRSATTPADLASNPVRVVVLDEVDKFPQWAGKEASPVALARERQRTYRHLARLYLSSTVDGADSKICAEWSDGDQRRYYVRCPHCGAWDALAWHRVKWPETVTTANEMRSVRQAWHECGSCHGRHEDAHKPAMMASGVWVPQRVSRDLAMSDGQVDAWQRDRLTDQTAHRSFHLWAGYSPWLTWWEIVAEWLRCKGRPEEEANFSNSWLAEPFEDRVENPTVEAVRKCIGDHDQGEVPRGFPVLTMAIDVQQDWLAWQVQAWAPGGSTAVVAAGTAETFWHLDKPLHRRWGEDGQQVRLCLIDSRARADEVLDWVRTRPEVRMIRGVRRESSPALFGTVRIDRHPRTGLPLPDAAIVWTVNVGPFRDRAWASVLRGGDKMRNPNGRLILPLDLPATWFEQMAAEQKVRKRNRSGSISMIWQKRSGNVRNEAFDLSAYNHAAAAMLQLHKLRGKKDGTHDPMAEAED